MIWSDLLGQLVYFHDDEINAWTRGVIRGIYRAGWWWNRQTYAIVERLEEPAAGMFDDRDLRFLFTVNPAPVPSRPLSIVPME